MAVSLTRRMHGVYEVSGGKVVVTWWRGITSEAVAHRSRGLTGARAHDGGEGGVQREEKVMVKGMTQMRRRDLAAQSKGEGR